MRWEYRREDDRPCTRPIRGNSNYGCRCRSRHTRCLCGRCWRRFGTRGTHSHRVRGRHRRRSIRISDSHRSRRSRRRFHHNRQIGRWRCQPCHRTKSLRRETITVTMRECSNHSHFGIAHLVLQKHSILRRDVLRNVRPMSSTRCDSTFQERFFCRR